MDNFCVKYGLVRIGDKDTINSLWWNGRLHDIYQTKSKIFIIFSPYPSVLILIVLTSLQKGG